jgi:hypothetical protein
VHRALTSPAAKADTLKQLNDIHIPPIQQLYYEEVQHSYLPLLKVLSRASKHHLIGMNAFLGPCLCLLTEDIACRSQTVLHSMSLESKRVKDRFVRCFVSLGYRHNQLTLTVTTVGLPLMLVVPISDNSVFLLHLKPVGCAKLALWTPHIQQLYV